MKQEPREFNIPNAATNLTRLDSCRIHERENQLNVYQSRQSVTTVTSGGNIKLCVGFCNLQTDCMQALPPRYTNILLDIYSKATTVDNLMVDKRYVLNRL